jgi:hypothetical protein
MLKGTSSPYCRSKPRDKRDLCHPFRDAGPGQPFDDTGGELRENPFENAPATDPMQWSEWGQPPPVIPPALGLHLASDNVLT